MIEKFIDRLLDHWQLMLVVIGVGVILVAAAGELQISGFRFVINDSNRLIVLFLIGLGLIGAGILSLDSGGQSPQRRIANLFLGPIEALLFGKPSGEITRVRTEHNVYKNDIKGMKILVSFSISGRKGRECDLMAYFFHKSGEPLKDTNGKNRTTKGNVCAWETFKPGYSNTVYKKMEVFIPYGELHLEHGQYSLMFYVALFDNLRHTTIVSSDYYYFTYG